MRITNASRKAIEYACKNFHYSKSVPTVMHAYNIYNDGNEWCGVIIYGGGANRGISTSFNKNSGEVLELERVALNGKQKITSQAVSLSLKKLHKDNPMVKIVVSYADIDQNHTGTIYQATNWIYLGCVNEGMVSAFIVNGKKTHRKTLHSRGYVQSLSWLRNNVDAKAKEFVTKGKHKYIYCYDKNEKAAYTNKAKPYPIKPTSEPCGNSSAAEQPSNLTGEGGATPTLPLQP